VSRFPALSLPFVKLHPTISTATQHFPAPMGKMIWHEWAQIVSIFACIYSAWAATWGVLFRKFFWDFLGGTLATNPAATNPNTTLKCDVNVICGMIPSASAKPFVMLIVDLPVVQLMTTLIALFMLALETVPYLKQTNLHRSFLFKAIMLLMQGLLASLFYQGTNGAIYSAVAALAYITALSKGEVVAEVKEKRGRGGSEV